MHKNHPGDLNPDRRYEIHSSDFQVRSENVSLHQHPKYLLPELTARLRFLDKILNSISYSDLPGKNHFSEFLQERYRRNCKVNSIRMHSTSLWQFLTFYGNSGKRSIDQMEREDIEAFVEDLQDRGLASNSVASRLRTVYAFIRFLIENKVLGYELLERRIRIKLPNRLPRAMDPEDLRKLLSVINSVRDRAMILLLLRTGMRIGELLGTKVHDVDLSNHRILIYEADKTGVGRVVYYSGDAREALIAWLHVRNPFKEHLFYGRGRDSLCYECARSMSYKYLEKAGLSYRGYTLHCLRHTFATELLNARMPLECLRVLLGHASLEVTRIYARLADKTREEEYFAAMEKILKGQADANDECDY
ncbi:MAG: tyrosine-type recombinase/integrase [Desulfobacterales bacterium]